MYIQDLHEHNIVNVNIDLYNLYTLLHTEAEFREFEPRLKFETRLKHGWFHL